jgi:hypothetical protein
MVHGPGYSGQPGAPPGNTVDLRQLKTKNEKLKSQNG